MKVRFWGLLPAAGVGRRVGGTVPKQYLALGGKPVLQIALDRLLEPHWVEAACVVIASDDPYWPETGLAEREDVRVAPGGAERCHSVLNGLAALSEIAAPDDWVLVHDAARPCVRREDLDRLAEEAGRGDGGLLAVPVHDTLKRANDRTEVAETVDRAQLWRAFTPQMFRLRPLREALETALAAGMLVTDESSAMELAGYRPRLVEGHADNIKITRREDLVLAEFYLRRQEEEYANRAGV